ncbi:putative porin [Litorimonas taeanensis]|uniref:Putative porin n=1 Tax=Litorimonas taeanensis TaxID=568099 RepID=A0A420WDX1_9PROT|nr:porin [Litorimonas taeanensis]RKQ69186.1 putative porin [Litorimonas taeanensis]
MRLPFYFLAALLGGGLCPAAAQAQTASDTDLELYGSWRLHANYVSVDESSNPEGDGELGLTDAYSRLGAKLRFGDEAIKITARYEVNINSADLELGDPSFFDDEDSRLYSVKAEGKFGTVLVGKDWLPYYNNIGYPVDYFSSIYAGYTTYAYFREHQITYITPRVNGFSGSLARMQRTGGGAKGWHYALSYVKNGVTLAAGREDMDGAEADTQGVALSYTHKDWYLAGKYEKNDIAGTIYNGFVQYRRGPYSFKAGLGLGDQYSGDTYHLGVDYHLNAQFKLFTEFYAEELNYALLRNDAQRASDYFGAGGFGVRQNGKAILTGFRWDFSFRPQHHQ